MGTVAIWGGGELAGWGRTHMGRQQVAWSVALHTRVHRGSPRAACSFSLATEVEVDGCAEGAGADAPLPMRHLTLGSLRLSCCW